MVEPEYYVLRTDKMTDPHYFAGGVETSFGMAVGICRTVFQAYEFTTRKDAKQCIKECGLNEADWSISECGQVGVSDSLMPTT